LTEHGQLKMLMFDALAQRSDASAKRFVVGDQIAQGHQGPMQLPCIA
jgi:hypothetical protein